MDAAWERHAMCESAFNLLLKLDGSETRDNPPAPQLILTIFVCVMLPNESRNSLLLDVTSTKFVRKLFDIYTK